MTDTITLPLSKLIAPPDRVNSRKSYEDDADLAKLTASICHTGLIQPLLVRQTFDENYEVIDGNRRLAAMNKFVKKGTEDGYQVPCVVIQVDDKAATQMSVAANTQRKDLHPADKFLSYQEMLLSGSSVEEVADAFGEDQTTVKARMKLGKLHPTVLAAYRVDTIGYNLAVQLTYVGWEKQMELVKKLKAGDIHAWQIRDIISNNTMMSEHHVIKAIGLKEYINAGGQVEDDLFSEDSTQIINTDLAHEMYGKKRAQIFEDAEGNGYPAFDRDDYDDQKYYRLDRIDEDDLAKHKDDDVIVIIDKFLGENYFIQPAGSKADKPKAQANEPETTKKMSDELFDLANLALVDAISLEQVKALDLISKITALVSYSYCAPMLIDSSVVPWQFLFGEDEVEELRGLLKLKTIEAKVKYVEKLDDEVVRRVYAAWIRKDELKSKMHKWVKTDISTRFKAEGNEEFFKSYKTAKLIALCKKLKVKCASEKKADLVAALAAPGALPEGWLPDTLKMFK